MPETAKQPSVPGGRVLLTGVAGLLGRRLLEILRPPGSHAGVAVLVRKQEQARYFEQRGVDALYFTFGFGPNEGDALVRYLRVNCAAEDALVSNGATPSHDHAVGYEHLPRLEQQISPAGLIAIQALKKGLDPVEVMNPAKLRAGFGFVEWGLPEESSPSHTDAKTQYREVGQA